MHVRAQDRRVREQIRTYAMARPISQLGTCEGSRSGLVPDGYGLHARLSVLLWNISKPHPIQPLGVNPEITRGSVQPNGGMA